MAYRVGDGGPVVCVTYPPGGVVSAGRACALQRDFAGQGCPVYGGAVADAGDPPATDSPWPMSP